MAVSENHEHENEDRYWVCCTKAHTMALLGSNKDVSKPLHLLSIAPPFPSYSLAPNQKLTKLVIVRDRESLRDLIRLSLVRTHTTCWMQGDLEEVITRESFTWERKGEIERLSESAMIVCSPSPVLITSNSLSLSLLLSKCKYIQKLMWINMPQHTNTN